jgi:hypothetical protein
MFLGFLAAVPMRDSARKLSRNGTNATDRKNRVEESCQTREKGQRHFLRCSVAYRITGLAAEPFGSLFALSDEELGEQGARRTIADEKPGFPCRISLTDAEPGERVILLSYDHLPVHSPYRARGPIFVREAATRFDHANKLPEVFQGRLLSVRAYDAEAMMVDADVVEGTNAEQLIERFLAREDVDMLHVHYARRGCYACRVERA